MALTELLLAFSEVDTKSGISQIPRGMAENTVEMRRKDSAKSGNVGITVFYTKKP